MLRSALIALAAVVAAATLATALRGTSAAFTAEQTTHLVLTTGGVGLTRDGDGVLFDSTPLAPGDTADATVKVTNSGTLPATVTLSREVLGSTAPGGCDVRTALRLQVVEAGGAGRRLVDGPVTDPAADVGLGTFAAGEARSYEIHVTFVAQHGAGATDNDNCFEGSVDRERFIWAAVEVGAMTRRIAIVAAVLAALAGGVGLASAAMTGGTDAGATLAGGRLSLVATPGATATSTLDTTNMRPGMTRSGTVELRNAGTVAARAQLTVRLAAPSPLADVLQLRVDDCADAACTTPAPRFAAALTDVADQPLGAIAAGATRTYRVTLAWPSDKADPALQGATAALTLDWTAMAGTSA